MQNSKARTLNVVRTVLVLFLVGLTSGLAAQTRYDIYIHGFTVNEQSCHDQAYCPKVWTEQHNTNPVRHVAYNGWRDPLVWSSDRGAYKLVSILNKYCLKSGPNTCRVFCHSMGCLTSGYVMANYGSNYRLSGVTAIASAQGGSEYANLGVGVAIAAFGILGGIAVETVVDALPRLMVSRARNSGYSHDDTDGVPFQHTVGTKDLFWPLNQILPGGDDSVVAFHSTCAMAESGGFDTCGAHSSNYWDICKTGGWIKIPYPCQKSRFHRQLDNHAIYTKFHESHRPIADKRAFQVPAN
ncbi:MAG: hypothetical protein JNM27_19505 [Leptospirales bacterium]|nr:hypothetical protein [Leptospirales bacterium]